jgi:hydroxyacylglutathione hydrolase
MLLHANNASEWTGPTGNNTYLLPGRPSILIDAGIGDAKHLNAIEAALDGAPLGAVLITHGHVDHVAGAAALTKRFAGVVIRGGGAGAAFADNERINGGGTTFLAIHTPGHAPDHFCFLDQATGVVYCGDLARAGGTVVIPASRGGNLREYLASLARIRALTPTRLLPGHGPAVEDPLTLIDEYVAHRAERERQILAAMKDGCTGIDDLVRRIYPGLSSTLVLAAQETVRAHLQKLHEDERR